MRILIGYDGAVPTEEALYDLTGAGLPAEAEAIVLTVNTAWGHDPAPKESRQQAWPRSMLSKPNRRHLDQALKKTQALADGGQRRLRDLFPTWEVKSVAAIDDAAEAILRKAASWKADLIVVGSGQSAISRDGSPYSITAVAEVCSRSWPEKSAVRLVAVIDTRSPQAILTAPTASRGEGRNSAIGNRDWLEKKIEAAVDQLAAVGLKAKPVILKGDPRRVLLEQAKDWRAHSIFLGSRGLNRVERFLIGSIASTVAMHAPCSVEVIKMKK